MYVAMVTGRCWHGEGGKGENPEDPPGAVQGLPETDWYRESNK